MKSIGTHRSYQIKTICNAPIELIDGDRGKNYPKQRDFSSSGYCLFLNAGNVTKSGLDFHECAFISEENDSLLGKGKLRRGDIIVTTRGTLGNIGYYDKSAPYDKVRINSGMIILRPIESELEAAFLYCYLRSALFQSQVTKLSSGSAQPQLPIRDFRNIEIPLPPLPEQRRIAHILGTLDDRIENNRKTVKTLEAMAQAIFKSWFVDFDPVRAKMAGESRESICKRLKLTPEILDLFPDRLVDSELGEIPEGWMNGSFRNICSRRSERVGNRDATVLSAVTKGHLAISDDYFTKRVYSNEIKNYLAVERNDFAYNPSRINIGSIGMLESYFLGAVSPVYIVFRPAESYQHFMNFYLGLATTKKWIATFSSGSVRQSLSYDDFAAIPCIIPPKETIGIFNIIHDDVKHSSDFSSDYAMKLANLRDTLLPKLISGELRVPALQDLVEDVLL